MTNAGMNRANKGFMTSNEAQMMPMLTSVVEKTIAYVPDSTRVSEINQHGFQFLVQSLRVTRPLCAACCTRSSRRRLTMHTL